jgi:predicted Zn finger-like uncharacterized protein
MSQSEAKAEVVCKNCGATFSAFLEQMAEHNQKVVCPKCGTAHAYVRSDVGKPQPSKPNR